MDKKYSEFEMKIISYYDTHKDLLHSLAMYDDVVIQAIALTLIKTAEDIKKGINLQYFYFFTKK